MSESIELSPEMQKDIDTMREQLIAQFSAVAAGGLNSRIDDLKSSRDVTEAAIEVVYDRCGSGIPDTSTKADVTTILQVVQSHYRSSGGFSEDTSTKIAVLQQRLEEKIRGSKIPAPVPGIDAAIENPLDHGTTYIADDGMSPEAQKVAELAKAKKRTSSSPPPPPAEALGISDSDIKEDASLPKYTVDRDKSDEIGALETVKASDEIPVFSKGGPDDTKDLGRPKGDSGWFVKKDPTLELDVLDGDVVEKGTGRNMSARKPSRWKRWAISAAVAGAVLLGSAGMYNYLANRPDEPVQDRTAAVQRNAPRNDLLNRAVGRIAPMARQETEPQTPAVESQAPGYFATFLEIDSRILRPGRLSRDTDILTEAQRDTLNDVLRRIRDSGRDIYVTGVSTPSGPSAANLRYSISRALVVEDALHGMDRDVQLRERFDGERAELDRGAGGIGGVIISDHPLPDEPIADNLESLSPGTFASLDEAPQGRGYETFTPGSLDAHIASLMPRRARELIPDDTIDTDLIPETEADRELYAALAQDLPTEYTNEQLELDVEHDFGSEVEDPYAPQVDEMLARLRAAYNTLLAQVNELPQQLADADALRVGNCDNIRDLQVAAYEGIRGRRARRQREAAEAAHGRCIAAADRELDSDMDSWRGAERGIAALMAQVHTVLASDAGRGYRVLSEQLMTLADVHLEQGRMFDSEITRSEELTTAVAATADWNEAYAAAHLRPAPPSVDVPRAELHESPEFELTAEYRSLEGVAEEVNESLEGSHGAALEYHMQHGQEVLGASEAHHSVTGSEAPVQLRVLEHNLGEQTSEAGSCGGKSYKTAQDKSYDLVVRLGERLEAEHAAQTQVEQDNVRSARLAVAARAYVRGADENVVLSNLAVHGISADELYSAATDIMLGDGTLLEEPMFDRAA